MELKMKYQYTNFVYPYIVEEKNYKKYIQKLLKNNKCKTRFFEKEKDKELYKYFLPNIRKFMFNNFSFSREKIAEFDKLDVEVKSTILNKYPCVFFEYKIDENIPGKVGEENGIFFKIDSIQLICFNTGICFEVIKTHIENSELFDDALDFNYKFKNVNYSNETIQEDEKIKIQTNNFENMQDVRKLINSLIIKTELTEKLDIDTEKLYTYAYICIDQESWNDNKNFEGIKNEFEKFANVLPSNYNVRGEKIKTYDIARFKYAKIGLTKTSTTLLTSGTEIYNYTKLPYEFENQYFYTYIIELYKNIYLKKIAVEYKKNKTQETRKKFINFSKNIWIQEITSQNEGNNFAKNWKKVLELETEYKEVKNKYDLMYKESELEKNEKINKIILVVLFISLVLNIINFCILLK